MQKYSSAEIIMSRKYQEFQEANPWVQANFSKPVAPEEFIPGESYLWVNDMCNLDLYDTKSHVDFDIHKVVFEDSPRDSNHKNIYFFRRESDGNITVRIESHGN